MTERDLPADAASSAEPARCPACGAVRPPSVGWCTQCYARFDVPAAASDPATDPATDPGPAAGLPVQPALGPAHPEREREDVPSLEELEARAQELLARLQAEGTDDAGLRSWSGRVQGRGQRLAVLVGGTLLLTGLAIGVMAVLGALL